MQTITSEHLLNWLGSDNLEKKSIDLLMDLINEHYTVKELKKDIENYAK